MAQIVKPNRPNTGHFQEPSEFALHIPLSQRRSRAGTEDQVVLYVASSVSRDGLRVPKTRQSLQHEALKLYYSATALSFRVVEDPASL